MYPHRSEEPIYFMWWGADKERFHRRVHVIQSRTTQFGWYKVQEQNRCLGRFLEWTGIRRARELCSVWWVRKRPLRPDMKTNYRRLRTCGYMMDTYPLILKPLVNLGSGISHQLPARGLPIRRKWHHWRDGKINFISKMDQKARRTHAARSINFFRSSGN